MNEEELDFIDWEEFLNADFSHREDNAPSEFDLYEQVAQNFNQTEKWDSLAYEVEFKKPLETETQYFGRLC